MSSVGMNLPNGVKYIIDKLNSSGYRADVVGGAVRDHLIGRCSFDYDLTTEATPDEVKAVFRDERIIETGIKHGTVTLLLDGVGYEITTWRVDGEYADNRHPDVVSFTRSLDEDLVRRDFTINAIAYNPTDGFTDLFGGREDIARGVVRAVGEPKKRFTEDALRILRGVRFAAELGFGIEPLTARAMTECLPLLKNVSAERIFAELKKLLAGDYALDVYQSDFEITSAMLPGVSAPGRLDREGFLLLDWRERLVAIYLVGSQSPREALSLALGKLRSDTALRRFADSLSAAYLTSDLGSRYSVLLALNKHGEEIIRSLTRIIHAVGGDYQEASTALEDALSSGIPYTEAALAVGGRDLVAMGVRGARVGELLSILLDGVMRGELINEREELLSEIGRLCRI